MNKIFMSLLFVIIGVWIGLSFMDSYSAAKARFNNYHYDSYLGKLSSANKMVLEANNYKKSMESFEAVRSLNDSLGMKEAVKKLIKFSKNKQDLWYIYSNPKFKDVVKHPEVQKLIIEKQKSLK